MRICHAVPASLALQFRGGVHRVRLREVASKQKPTVTQLCMRKFHFWEGGSPGVEVYLYGLTVRPHLLLFGKFLN